MIYDMLNQMLRQMLRSLGPWGLLFGILFIVVMVARVVLGPKLKGRLGEAAINFLARRFLDPAVYHLIPDVMLPTPDGTTQIDHVLVSRYGVFVIDTKTYKGWIYGSEREAQWTQVIFKRKERFQNPLRQNFKHIKTLADLTGIPEECVKSLIVFVGNCTFKTTMPANVVYVRDFVRYVKSFQTPIIQDEQVSEIVDVISAWAGTITDKQKAGHVAHLMAKKAAVSASAPPPACPRCGATMVLRSSRNGRSQFWGCPKYPACRGMRQAVEK